MSRILIVEDDDVMRHLLAETLTGNGFDVRSARNGVMALELLETTAFDLVITDLIMPDMEGLELLRQMRRRHSLPPTIAISGGGRGSASDYLEIATLFGAVETLPKPFALDVLLSAVRRALVPRTDNALDLAASPP